MIGKTVGIRGDVRNATLFSELTPAFAPGLTLGSQPSRVGSEFWSERQSCIQT